MIEAFEFIGQFIDYRYLIAILGLGQILSRDKMVDNLPFKIRACLLKVDVAWRILILSLFMGVIWYYMRKWSGNKTEAELLLITYLVANGFYALIMKYVFKWIGKYPAFSWLKPDAK